MTLEQILDLPDYAEMRSLLLVLSILPVFCLSLRAQETIVPAFLQTTDVPEVPYAYNGLLYVGNAIGSASLVGEGIIATAAHVIFNEDDLTWVPINQIRFYPQYHRTTPFQPSGTLYPPIGFSRWTSYATRVENDDSGPGLSTPDTFNLDFAVGYLNKFVQTNQITLHPEVHVDAEGEVGILRDNRNKMIVGYPSDSDFVSSSVRGLMHRTEPANYVCFWGGLEDFASTWRDSEDYWLAIYDFEGVTTYGGNSGGPMYAENDEGQWVVAGIVVGSNGSDGVLIRGIDDEAWRLIDETITTRDASTLWRVDDLMATGSPTSVALQWDDTSASESGYVVFRLDSGVWAELARVQANTTTYLDESVLPGKVYHYRVQPIAANGNRRPLSPIASTTTAGLNTGIAAHLGQPLLNFRTDGDANWHLDGQNRLRAGKVRSMGASSLKLTLIGPGTLTFDWRVSSEVNTDYGNPASPNAGSIYDALYLYLNGEPVMAGNEPLFLSGIIGTTQATVAIPEGPQVVEWRYEKDPYSDEGEDTGFLETLEWVPQSADSYPVFGGFAYAGTEWHGSAWLGAYSVADYPWVGHLELGWIYLHPGNGNDLFLYSAFPELGELYTRPGLYPWFYHYGRDAWLRYYTGSGAFGQGMWFHDQATGTDFQIRY